MQNIILKHPEKKPASKMVLQNNQAKFLNTKKSQINNEKYFKYEALISADLNYVNIT